MARLDHILSGYARARRQGRACALATVVDVAGSGSRRPGARLLVVEGGEQIGAISGGCLEREVARAALVRREGWLMSLDTRGDALRPYGRYGTGCEGVVTVLLQRVDEGDGAALMEALAGAQQAGEALVVAHCLRGERAGEQAWLWSGGAGQSAGFGGVTDGLLRRMESGRAMIFDGIFIERVEPAVELLAVGSGEEVRALMEVSGGLGWRRRVAWTDPVRLRDLQSLGVETHLIEGAAGLGELRIGEATRVVLMTHSLSFDVEALPLLLGSRARLVGVLGPAARAGRLMAMLHERGMLPDAAQLERLRAPVGLDLGAEDAWEIAASVVAQVVGEAHGRSGGALHGRGGVIHDRVVSEASDG